MRRRVYQGQCQTFLSRQPCGSLQYMSALEMGDTVVNVTACWRPISVYFVKFIQRAIKSSNAKNCSGAERDQQRAAVQHRFVSLLFIMMCRMGQIHCVTKRSCQRKQEQEEGGLETA